MQNVTRLHTMEIQLLVNVSNIEHILYVGGVNMLSFFFFFLHAQFLIQVMNVFCNPSNMVVTNCCSFNSKLPQYQCC